MLFDHRGQDLPGLVLIEDGPVVLGLLEDVVSKVLHGIQQHLNAAILGLVLEAVVRLRKDVRALHVVGRSHLGLGRRVGRGGRPQVQVCLMDSDPLLDIFLAELPLGEVHEELHLLLVQLECHCQQEAQVFRRQGDVMLGQLPNGDFPTREKLLVALVLLSPAGIRDLEQAVQHVLPLVITVELPGVHDLEQLLAVVLGLHPFIILCQVLHVVKRNSAEVTKQHWSAALGLRLRRRQPQSGPYHIVPERR